MSLQIADIYAARQLLEGIVIQTPTLPDAKLAREIGANAFLKAECLQKSGSFKIRGAYYKIAGLTDEEKSRGVIAASAGNHAQGVALAARLTGIKATIVLPLYAPLTKINATKSYGAEIVLHGENFDEALAFSHELQKKFGYTYIHPFDDERVIAGQGTIGLEIVEAVPDVSVIVVPIGGGGLISGIAVAAKSLVPNIRIVGVQAAAVAPVIPSLEAGQPISVASRPTIADGIAVKHPGKITFPLIEKYVDEVVEVSDEEIARAIFFAAQNNRLVVEGAGAAGLAAMLAGKINFHPDDIACAVLCGGNIDPNLLSRILEQVLVRQGRYVMLKFLVDDRPGNLARLTASVGETGANIIDVFHRRAMWLAPLGRAGIEMLLEVRDEPHAREVVAHLETAGYHVEREGIGEWEN